MHHPLDLASCSSQFPSFNINGRVDLDMINAALEMNGDLSHVKALFFDRNYKKCISRSEQLLGDNRKDAFGIQDAYLNFYIALSYDALARNMRVSSSHQTSAYEMAEQYYRAAEAALPRKLKEPSRSCYVDSRSCGRNMSPIHEEDETPDKASIENSNQYTGSLQIDYSKIEHSRTSSNQLPSSPPSLSHSPCSTPPSELKDGSSKPESFIGELTEANLRFATSVGMLRSLLHQHINSVQAARLEHRGNKEDIDVPTTNRASSDAKNTGYQSQAPKRRFGGPRRRPRFNAERYKDLCDQALAEL